MNDDATINENGGKYAGLDRYEARESRIVEELAKKEGFLVRIEDYSTTWAPMTAVRRPSSR